MADIELMIKIDEEDFKIMKHNIEVNNPLCPLSQEEMVSIVANGIPLPKQHGKIIDADSIPSYRIRGVTEYCRGYNDRTTEVENAIVNAPIILK